MSSAVRVAHLATIDLTVRALLLPQLRALREAGFDVTAVSAPGPFVEEIEAHGIRHIQWVNATRSWDVASDLRAFRELLGILRRERFDLVHTHNAKPGVMGRVAARVTGIPCVVNTVHGFDATSDDRWPRRLAFMGAEWIAAQFSDLELYQGRADLNRSRRLGMVGAGKAVFLGNGADLTRFDPSLIDAWRAASLREELGLAGAAVVVGTLGRLVGEKGYRELFAAARRVRARCPEVHFLAIGDRDPAKADALTEEELRDAEIDVTFTGWREDIPELLALLDVFVLPSWREGVPRSAIEASAMAKPMVLTDIPGCRQVARNGVEAIFVPARDSERLAAAIEELVRDPGRRTRMGEAARRTAVRRFDERKVIETILCQYERVLRRKVRVR